MLAQLVNCNHWTDKNLAQAAVWEKATTEGVAKCFYFLPLCCLKILQLKEWGRGKSLICTKITFSIWVSVYLTSTDVPLLFCLSWMNFRIKLGIGWFTAFRAYFVKKWEGLFQGCVGCIHTFVFAAVSLGSAVHQPLPNVPLFSSVPLLCLACSLRVAAVNHPNPSPS